MKDVAIGIDIGGTNTKFGIVDRKGEMLSLDSVPTQATGSIETYLEDLSQHIHQAIEKIEGPLKIWGIGIGAPNGNYYSGNIEYAPNIKWGDVVPIIDLFKKHFDLPMVLTNDANAAALGELIYGSGKGKKDFVMITLGTGLGSGIIANGDLIMGHDGFAAELGHVTVNPNGRVCGCGKRGCLETYVSATGIKRTVYKMLADYTWDSELRGVSFNDLSGEMITKAALRGDKIARESFEYTGKILGQKLADTVAHTSPEVIYLFGGLVKAGDLLLNPARKHLEENLFPVYRNKIKLEPSGLMDKNVAVLGASALVWKEFE